MARLRCKALDELSQRTGIPKYQHHVAVSDNGRLFFPGKLLERWKITQEDAFVLDEVQADRCRLLLRHDKKGELPYHLHAAHNRSTPCIVVMRRLVCEMTALGYDFPRRMRFASPPQPTGLQGERELWLEFRRVRDLYAIGEELHWVVRP